MSISPYIKGRKSTKKTQRFGTKIYKVQPKAYAQTHQIHKHYRYKRRNGVSKKWRENGSQERGTLNHHEYSGH